VILTNRFGTPDRQETEKEIKSAPDMPIEAPVSAVSMPQIEAPAVAAMESTGNNLGGCVLTNAREDVSDCAEPLPTLEQLAEHYLSLPATAIGRRSVNKRTGAVNYRRTAPHFADLVVEHYGSLYTRDAAIVAYRSEQDRREALAQAEWKRFFQRLGAMPDAELIAYVTGCCRSEVAELAREGASFDKHLYHTRLKCAKQHLEWRGLTMPSRKTTLKPVTPKRKQAGPASHVYSVPVMIARLKRRRDEHTTQQVLL
jgi:hypothetical protein